MEENKTLNEKQKAKAKTKKAAKEQDFESALERLNVIASVLENENPHLSKALELYEESAALLKLCTELLDNATKKITVLEKDN